MHNFLNGTQNGFKPVALPAAPDDRSPFVQTLPLTEAIASSEPADFLEPIQTIWHPSTVQPIQIQHKSRPDAANNLPERKAQAAELLRQADVYLMQGRVEPAIAHYERALQFVPDLIEAHQGLAEAFTQQGNLEAAAAHYQTAIALLPDPGEIIAAQPSTADTAAAIASLSNPAAAEAISEFASESSESTAGLDSAATIESLPWQEQAAFYLHQGKASCDRQQWQESMIACQQAAGVLVPRLALTFRLLGQALQADQQFAAAEQAYQKSLAIDANVAETYARLGSLYAEQQRLSEAVEALQQAIDRDAQFAGAYLKLGQVWEQLGDRLQAADCQYRAAQLQPDWMTAKEHLQLGNLLMAQGKFEPASQCYRQVIDRVPQSPNAYHNLAIALGRQQKWREAIHFHQQAIDRQSNNPALHAAMGQALTQANRWQEAIACYETLMQLDPDYGQVQEALAQIEFCQRALIALSYGKMAATLADRQQWQEAIHCYQQAIDRNPQNAQFQLGLARVWMALQQWESAAECYRQAIDLQPDQSEHRLTLAALLAKLGQFEAATQYYHQSVSYAAELPAAVNLPASKNSSAAADAYTVL